MQVSVRESKKYPSKYLRQHEAFQWNGKKPSGPKRRVLIKGKTAAEYVLEDRR